jgi:hypothetical protein
VSAAVRLVMGGMLSLLVARQAAGQLRPELRADVIGPRPYSVQPGAGLITALGYYARVSANVGYAIESEPAFIADRWRVDVMSRFLLDPFRQQRWGLSLGGGLSVRRRTFMLVVVDLEGPAMAGWLPALQVGAGGGFRAGLALRRAVAGRR